MTTLSELEDEVRQTIQDKFPELLPTSNVNDELKKLLTLRWISDAEAIEVFASAHHMGMFQHEVGYEHVANCFVILHTNIKHELYNFSVGVFDHLKEEYFALIEELKDEGFSIHLKDGKWRIYKDGSEQYTCDETFNTPYEAWKWLEKQGEL